MCEYTGTFLRAIAAVKTMNLSSHSALVNEPELSLFFMQNLTSNLRLAHDNPGVLFQLWKQNVLGRLSKRINSLPQKFTVLYY